MKEAGEEDISMLSQVRRKVLRGEDATKTGERHE